MLKRLILRLRKGLARRVLNHPLRLVSDTILYALVIYSVGCIVPTPLDPTPAPTNFAPVFVSATPNFGPLTRTQTDLIEFDVSVDDPDINDPGSQDELHARLFFLDSSNMLQWLDGNDLSPTAQQVTGDMGDPRLRFFQFPAIPRCAGRSGQTIFVYVIVSDRKFSTTNPSMPQAGGLTDTNHWELTCT